MKLIATLRNKYNYAKIIPDSYWLRGEIFMSGHSKWANIKHKKGKMDALRGKVTTKIGRELTVAARMGGADPTGNMRLKLALQKAKENNIPKDNIQRAIQKGLGSLDGSNYEELVYEGYGPAGVAVMVEVMTDNRNRTAADVRHLFSKYSGNLGESGCVSWMFDKKGLFIIEKVATIDEEELMMLSLEAGADDFKVEDNEFEITVEPDLFYSFQEVLEKNGIKTSVAEITMIPQTTVALAADDATRMMKLMDALEEHDDIQEVYANFDIPEDLM
ncbi:MAG: protein yeeN [Firmicutes bacterium]|nr:protein yeeN [Bacillota bacterium]